MNKLERIITGDGSHSLRVPGMDETYHSRHGAVAESQHVFIEKGLNAIDTREGSVRVFEVGFGTGLNALLAWIWAKANNKIVQMVSVEKYPLPVEEAEMLNYGTEVTEATTADYQRLHRNKWNEVVDLDDRFSLLKMNCDLDEVDLLASFDLVFYDAFGPRVQPNMWSVEKLAVVECILVPGGVLVTYCAQGQFRRNLKSLGMHWESIPGPPGKREMTRAVKPNRRDG